MLCIHTRTDISTTPSRLIQQSETDFVNGKLVIALNTSHRTEQGMSMQVDSDVWALQDTCDCLDCRCSCVSCTWSMTNCRRAWIRVHKNVKQSRISRKRAAKQFQLRWQENARKAHQRADTQAALYLKHLNQRDNAYCIWISMYLFLAVLCWLRFGI
jgi:hypothetical protein